MTYKITYATERLLFDMIKEEHGYDFEEELKNDDYKRGFFKGMRYNDFWPELYPLVVKKLKSEGYKEFTRIEDYIG